MKGTLLLTAVGRPTSVSPDLSSQGLPLLQLADLLREALLREALSPQSLDPDSLAPEFPGNFGVI